MVTRQRTSNVRRNRHSAVKSRRKNPVRPMSGQVENVYGLHVPQALHEAIEVERDNLAKVESLLACMAASMECHANAQNVPYFPDVVQVTRELVARSIDGLDPFELKRRLLNKVDEAYCISISGLTYDHWRRSDSRQSFIGWFGQCG